MIVKLKDNTTKEVDLLSYEETLDQLKFLKNIRKLRNKQINNNIVRISELEEIREQAMLKINSLNNVNQKEEIKLKTIERTINQLDKNRLLTESKTSKNPYTKFIKAFDYFERCQECD